MHTNSATNENGKRLGLRNALSERMFQMSHDVSNVFFQFRMPDDVTKRYIFAPKSVNNNSIMAKVSSVSVSSVSGRQLSRLNRSALMTGMPPSNELMVLQR